MAISASAPCNAILFGEHYVVYGASALSIPIEPRNRVEILPGGDCIVLSSSIGKGTVAQDFSFSGDECMLPYAAVAKEALSGRKFAPCSVSFLPAWGMKGVGASSSLGAAFAAGLLSLSGRKPTARKIFSCSQAGDLVAHAGKASGIDAKTVSMGKPLVFRRDFSSGAYPVRSVKYSIPQGSSLLIIDTFSGTRGSTAEALSKFARSFGITSLPQQTSGEKRGEVQAEFSPILKSALCEKTAEGLGKLMNDNHILLKMRGVSSHGIEKAVSAALSCGAYGAKLTGAGGEGGAVLTLVKSTEAASVAERIKELSGFPAHHLSLARKGASAD